MAITLNGTTGVVTPGATVGAITGILKATSGVVAQAVAGSDYGQLTLATAQTASGTTVDFTSIPSWAKQITVMMNGVSTTGTSDIIIQIGSGSFSTTGYVSGGSVVSGTAYSIATSSIGFLINASIAAGNTQTMIATIYNVNSNNWIYSALGSRTSGVATSYSGSAPALAGTLDRIRVTTANGTDQFDAGTINISYE